jgi:hypothetical protein
MLREESLETEKITVKSTQGGNGREREREKRQVNLPKTRSTVEDKSPLTRKKLSFFFKKFSLRQ